MPETNKIEDKQGLLLSVPEDWQAGRNGYQIVPQAFKGKGRETVEKNFFGVKDVADRVYRHFLNVPDAQTSQERLFAEIREAETAWKLAEGRFNEATDPDLIDFATYDIMAAKSRYEFLIKQAKEAR